MLILRENTYIYKVTEYFGVRQHQAKIYLKLTRDLSYSRSLEHVCLLFMLHFSAFYIKRI